MKYNQPYGIEDLDAPYINGDPSIGRAGSIPPAESIEYDQREIVNFITASGITPSNSDLNQLTKAVQTGKVIYGTDTGTANAMVAAFNPPIAALTPGLTVRIRKIGSKNTGATTLNVGTGVNNVRRASGAVLSDNDLPASIVAEMIWDGAVWQLANFQGTGVAETVNNYVLGIPYAVATGTGNAMIAAFSPDITALAAGLTVEVKAIAANTGAVTLQTAPGASVRAVIRPDGTPLQANDIVTGTVCLMIYNGTAWQYTNDLAISNLDVYNITKAPFADVAVFTHSANVTAPSYVNTRVPQASMTGGAAGNVSLVGGSCKVLVAGRYLVACTMTVSGFAGTENTFGLLGGAIHKNGALVAYGVGHAMQNSGYTIKETYGGNIVAMDCVVNDLIDLYLWQTNNGATTFTMRAGGMMEVIRVR